jgi:hypothetical protein
MKTTVGVVAALVFAGTAYVQPVHAQTMPQAPAPPAQTQPYGTAAQTQPYGTSAQTRAPGAMPPAQTPPQTPAVGTTGAEMGKEAQLPQGSYRSNCKNIRMLGQTLVAFCEKSDGTWQTTELGPIGQCVGDIQNVNGELTCNETGYGSSVPPATAQPAPGQRR